jgi:twitching motility protein PilT
MPLAQSPLLDAIFADAVALGASDIHLAVGSAPVYRVDGNLQKSQREPISQEGLMQELKKILREEAYKKFEERQDQDFSYTLPTKERFRTDIYWKTGQPGLAARYIPAKIPTLDELDAPDAVYDFLVSSYGIVLVTGPTGAGKTTLLASMVEHINQTEGEHIITLEDPIEFIFEPKMSLISQRELGMDFPNFAEGLKHVFRQDPDVVLIGEMRDPETIISALTLAETGHLVFATLHTNGAASTVERIINTFPAIQQQQIRLQLSLVLKGVISQLLLPTTDGKRVAAREVMVNTAAVGNIIREGKTEQLQNVIYSSQADKMVDLDQDLSSLLEEGRITQETAYEYARAKKKFT